MPRMKPPRDLTQGPIGPTLLAFLLPILAGGVLQSLNGSVNAVWVGRFLGEQALTATANANNIMFFLVGAVFGIGMASTILVGQSIGAKDMVQAKRVIGTSFTFFVAISLSIALVGMFASRRILIWMSTPADALPLAEAYLRIVFMAVPFIYVFAMLQATLRGAGDTRTPFIFLLMGVGLDIVFNPLLIFGIGPFPKMGIAGSATAMLIANSVSLAAMILWLRHRRHPLWISRHENRVYKPDWSILRALIVKGVPMGLQMIVISLAMIMMISMVNGYGVETTSAYGAAMQLWAYIQMPAMAIGAACSSMAAQNVGAKRWDRVSATARTGILFNFLLTGVLILPTIAFDRSTLSLFLPEGSAALEHARHLNHIAVWSFLFFGVTFVISGVVRATGAVLPPLLILASALWGIRIPFAEFLQPSLGADAIWWSFPVSSVCAMLMSLAYYRWGGWRKARMLAPHAEEVAIPAEVPAQPPSPVADQGTKT
jgi:putative MATE family efflux protein